MYTPEMASAFKAIKAPEGFGVVLYENPDFITVEVDPKDLIKLSDEDKLEAVKYVNDVKRTLESFGIVVFVVRKALEE